LRQFVKFVLLYQYIRAMEKKLVKKAGAPYYLQLKNILRNLIHSGDLKEGRIPPIRQLAREYGVSVNTALRAYESLRREGLLAGAAGRGTFVTASTRELQRHNRQGLLRRVVEHALEEALALACSIEEFSEAVAQLVREKRERLRKALAQDEGWTKEYIPKIRPMLLAQENKILYAVDGIPLTPPIGNRHVYELRTYRTHVGKVPEWVGHFKAALPVRE